MKPWLKTLLKYSITSLFGIGLFFLTVSLRNIWTQTDKQQIMRFLADGFTIPGIFLVLAFLLVYVANKGAFHGIGYALKHLGMMLVPFIAFKSKHETYKDYLEKRKQLPGTGFIFVVGLVFLGLAVLFTVLFYVV